MKPAALDIRLTLTAPRCWQYTALKFGELVAYSDPDGFDHPGKALAAALQEVKASMSEPPEEGGNDE